MHRRSSSCRAASTYIPDPLSPLQGYIPYPHIAAECMFELVVLLLPGHMWGVHKAILYIIWVLNQSYLSCKLAIQLGHLQWCNGQQARIANPTQVSSSHIGCPIHSALCHIEAKYFINCYLVSFPSLFIIIYINLFLSFQLAIQLSYQLSQSVHNYRHQPVSIYLSYQLSQKVGIKGGEGQERAEARTLLVCAAH